MTTRRRRKVDAPEHLERAEEWGGLRRGDPVEIDGVAGRQLTWRFLAFVTNTRSAAQWVEVIGGRPGEEHLRAFAPDQVYPVGGRRRGSASLADAPQLPLGGT